MKLSAADIDRLVAENTARPKQYGSADEFLDPEERRRRALVHSYSENPNQSRAKTGEILPRAPRDLRVVPDSPNDFGLEYTTTTATGEGEAAPELPRALAGVDLNTIQTRSELIQQLTVNLPLSEMGFPRLIYRSDMLDLQIFQGENSKYSSIAAQIMRYAQMQDYLDSAAVYLNNNEGFPALPDGQPFWSPLPHEAKEQFNVFLEYCELPGVRQLNLIKSKPLPEILSWFHEFYWSHRARCYDLHHAVHHAKVREARILRAENDHYEAANKIFAKLTGMMATIDWDYLAEDPEKFVAVMEKVQKMTRTAMGLSPQGGGSNDVRTETVETTLKRIQGPETAGLKLNDEGTVDVRQILRNPEALASAQELIVRMTKTISQRQAEQEPE